MKYFLLFLTLPLLSFKLIGSNISESTIEPWGHDRDLATPSFQSSFTKKEAHFSDPKTLQDFFQQNASQNEQKKNIKFGLDYLKKEKTEREKVNLSLAQKSCKAMIRFFQIYISPIDGPRSSFYPTSSQYALEAIQKYGVLTGIGMGCDRLLRENHDVWVYDVTEKYGNPRKLDPVR